MKGCCPTAAFVASVTAFWKSVNCCCGAATGSVIAPGPDTFEPELLLAKLEPDADEEGPRTLGDNGAPGLPPTPGTEGVLEPPGGAAVTPVAGVRPARGADWAIPPQEGC